MSSSMQHHQEICDMGDQLKDVDVENIIHTSRIRRMAEQHLAKAKLLQSQIKNEAIWINREANSEKKVGTGIKKISRASC